MDSPRCERRYAVLRRRITRRLQDLVPRWASRTLTEASSWALETPGKQIRGVLVMLSAEAAGGRARDALDAAVAVETLHSFTLVHDDIMDNAAVRRGRPSVHARWNSATALLVGDALTGLAYGSLLRSPREHLTRAATLFTRGLVEVCEGQALDLEFERRREVSREEYFLMIEKKTARLVAVAAELGACIGGGNPSLVRRLRAFGFRLGRAFQLQDDLLDATADESRLGKPVGGDIREGKKTILLLTALERTGGRDRALLRGLGKGTRTPGADRRLVESVTHIYEREGVLADTALLVRTETDRALGALGGLPPSRARDMLRWLALRLLNRTA
ncbi:MAG: polyprenyl synthetase family protein [Bacteroidota bacterium]